ncbi:cell division ATP-binding protein FtsE [Nitrospirales bacterium NOB]|nr:MAG: cell division protein FtsE [Nitrospira sp. OLB3]MBV6470306.1 Cell division ATP-binding protein FtsE [Nitrospirota bacterium]MCE7964336.1 cell division ATP-binding protein FtsE [Nitrospira sp. NTP2]MCK6493332.1 cell division ATP-binding protein FtsE [Nitrospira sp.]MDL1890689.1 cell division ATP-binding protein FtsE [Nitrospirales bacterium NOB]MEB2337342.1 cell division ATP-binding protein FtsE [Nitrospirales bacterium]
MIQLFHVSKYYDGRPALADVTLEVDKGEFILLMGPSGAGKSTLLKLLIGAERADDGQVFVQGRNLSKLRSSDIPALRRKVGVVLQDFRLLPKKTVFDNVSLPLLVQGAPAQEIRRKVTEALRAVGLDHKKDLFPPGLSTGEQQRICIARAIVNGPIVLLADEPTGNLDPELTTEIIELFKAINARGTTVMVATHDPHVLAQVNRRVITLERGRIVSHEGGRS